MYQNISVQTTIQKISYEVTLMGKKIKSPRFAGIFLQQSIKYIPVSQ